MVATKKFFRSISLGFLNFDKEQQMFGASSQTEKSFSTCYLISKAITNIRVSIATVATNKIVDQVSGLSKNSLSMLGKFNMLLLGKANKTKEMEDNQQACYQPT